MSEGNRPSLTRSQTRASEQKRNAELDQGLRMTIDGEAFEVKVGDVTPELASELRRHTGMGFFKLMQTCADDPDIDVISAFVWLARRVRGERRLEFSEVSVSYKQILADDGFEVSVAGSDVDEDGDTDPQT